MALLAIASVGSLGTLMTVAAIRNNTLQRCVILSVYALVSKVDRMSARGYDTFMSEGHIAPKSDRKLGAHFGARCCTSVGVLHLQTGVLRDHDPQHWVVSQRTYPDDPHATAPLFKLKRYVTHR